MPDKNINVKINVQTVGASNGRSTVDALSPIRDPEARRVCSLNGIGLAKDKVVSLNALGDSLRLSIREFESDRRTERWVNRGLLVARLTQATSDAFLSMASAMAKAVLPKEAGDKAELVDNVYNFAKPIASTVATVAAGGKVDKGKAITDIAKGGVRVFVHNEGYKLAAESTVLPMEVVSSALNRDKRGAIKGTVEFIYDQHTNIFDMLADDEKKGGGANAFKALSAVMKIAKSGYEYNEKLGEAFDEFLEEDEQSEERLRALKNTMLEQAKRIEAQVSQFQEYIDSCQSELDQTEIASLGSRKTA